MKFMKVISNSIQRNAKSARRQKASFPKESVENVDLYKPILNKIITTRLIREIEFRSSFNDIPFFSAVLPTCSLARFLLYFIDTSKNIRRHHFLLFPH